MKAMISQPMNGKTEEEILKTKRAAERWLKDNGYEVVNTYFDDKESSEELLKADGIKAIPLYYLAKSLEKMSECDAVYFAEGWESARGCRLEYKAATAYGLGVITQVLQEGA